ncbi:MAG: hypothetical protein ACRDV9_08285, partial [Acidimicrobiia bacterium]
MERMVLVSGSSARVAEVGDALEKPGVAVIRAVDREVLNGGCSSLPPRSLACYVQLPQETEVSEASESEPALLGRVHRFLTGGLVARFEAALAVAPLLRPDACVVLVAGEVPR